MNNARRLLNNTAMLTATALLMRTVSVGFNVYLTNLLGASGMGLFQLVTSVYSMAITFSTAGVRLASMRLVADSLALNKSNQRSVMNLCLLYGFLCGLIVAFVMLTGSELIANRWIENEKAISSIKILAVSLPFVSMSSALNGYFTSEGKIMRYTWVQIFEQIFKIAVTVMLIKSSAVSDIEICCRNIVIGITCAEFFSLIFSFCVYMFTSRNERLHRPKNTVKNLLRIALPDATGSEIRSTLSTVEHMLIPKGLKKYGGSVESSMAVYGIVHGMTLPIILYPGVLLTSLSGLLVPEISSHFVSGKYTRINYIIKRVLHLTLIFAIGVSGIMFFNSEKLSYAFYSHNQCAFYIRILAPLVVVMYTDMAVDGMLKGLDQQLSYMKYNIIDAGSCVVFVYFLVPVMGVKGYIFVIYLSEIINFVLSFRRLSVVSDVSVNLNKDIFLPFLCISVTGLICNFLNLTFSFEGKLEVIILILIQWCIYIFLLRAFHSVDKEESQWLHNLIWGRKN